MSSPKVLLAHPGTQYSHQLARQLYKRRLLYRFYTGIAFSSDSLQSTLIQYLPRSWRKAISNRFIDEISDSYIFRNTEIELRALWALRQGRTPEDTFFKRNKQFQEQISDVALQTADIVIGFDTSSWILASRCKKLNKRFILDVSIPHPRAKEKVYAQILHTYPEWSFAVQQKSQELIDLELEEMQLADTIVVASTFSKRTLIDQGIEDDKIVVNPYGTDLEMFGSSPLKPITSSEAKINFVFVGLVDARKGIPVLLEAWSTVQVSKANLTIIGPISSKVLSLIQSKFPEINLVGKIPYQDLPAYLENQDVLVFPSYFEGFGLVIPEAMAAGLAVITTFSTCGPDIMVNGEHGFIIPVGDSKILADTMNQIIGNRLNLNAFQLNARKQISNFTWDTYGERWRNILEK